MKQNSLQTLGAGILRLTAHSSRLMAHGSMLALFFVLTGLNGCKESCDDVVCGPAPPLLTLIVQDTLTTIVLKRQWDSLTGDSIDVPQAIKDVRATVDAFVTLNTVTSGVVGAPFDTVRTLATDTSFAYFPGSNVKLPSGEFALVAARGSRADTLENLSVKRVEGCCGYDIVGNYTVRIPEQE